jgi:hypothetical protein
MNRGERAGKRGNFWRRAGVTALAGAVGGAALALWQRHRAGREQARGAEFEVDWSPTPVRIGEYVPAAHIPQAAPGSPARMVRLRAEAREIEKHVADGAYAAVAFMGGDSQWRVGAVVLGNLGRDQDRHYEPINTVAVHVSEATSATMVLGYQETDGTFYAVPTRADSYCAPHIMQQIHPETPHIS